jgi:hypothetical protein
MTSLAAARGREEMLDARRLKSSGYRGRLHGDAKMHKSAEYEETTDGGDNSAYDSNSTV